MAIVEISTVPLGVESSSLSSYIAEVVRVAKESGIKYELTAMGTILTGDLDQIMPVVRKMHESCFGPHVPRVLTIIRIDDRRDKLSSPQQKVRSVIEKL